MIKHLFLVFDYENYLTAFKNPRNAYYNISKLNIYFH